MATRRAWSPLRVAPRTELASDLIVFPELTLSGYPPEDLLFHRGFRRQVDAALARMCNEAGDCGVIVGYPEYSGKDIYNSGALIAGGTLAANHRKSELPNYKVFDEKRYFRAGTQPTVVEHKGFRIGLLVCEDIWEPEPPRNRRATSGAELLVVLNASPYEIHKQRERESVVRERVLDVRLPVVYVNSVGGQDELVFDGNSFVMDANGKVVMRAPAFEEGIYPVDFTRDDSGKAIPLPGALAPELSDEASVYRALVLGVRDYVNKHGFPGVVMGLSGGVDSSLTMAIAVDALGAERVHAVMMPSRYTADMSVTDAAEQARAAEREIQRHLHRRDVRGDAGGIERRIRRHEAGHDGREHPVSLSHAHSDGHLEQDGAHVAHHGQQERDGGGLRHALR